MSDINDLIQKIKQFRDDRDWMQFHDPKNMAISIVIEAAELLELFQWKDKEEIEEHVKKYKHEIKEEIADVAIYLFELADNIGIDLVEAIQSKLRKNDKKYPVSKAKGKHTKYDKF